MATKRVLLLILAAAAGLGLVSGRPLVRQIRSTNEFDRLLRKHAGETGLPVIVDFYSDGCGPCRQIAPAYKRLAKEIGQDRAVFVKVDMNNPQTQELSQRYQVRSMPTFAFFYGGKKVSTFAGAGEQQLRQNTQQVVRQSDLENVVLRRKTLDAYYAEKDAEKNSDDIDKVYSKCAGMTKVNRMFDLIYLICFWGAF